MQPILHYGTHPIARGPPGVGDHLPWRWRGWEGLALPTITTERAKTSNLQPKFKSQSVSKDVYSQNVKLVLRLKGDSDDAKSFLLTITTAR